jgi:integrase
MQRGPAQDGRGTLIPPQVDANQLNELCAANPMLYAVVVQLAGLVAGQARGEHGLAGGGRGWDAHGSSQSENFIAQDGGSSTTEEEPMFEKLYGPYFKRGRFHVHIYFLDGKKQYRTFATEEEARDFITHNERKVIAHPITMTEAVDRYVESRTDLKESSRVTLKFRLEALIRGNEEVQLHSFPAHQAWERIAKGTAVDTLHGIRSVANGFFAFCVKQGDLKKNPLAGIEIVGRKKCGKAQLRLDEARSFLERALAVADGNPICDRKGNQQLVGTLGAATALLLGLRNGEVVGCTVRDLDDGGKMLWIAQSKTEAGIRRVEIPDILRPYLVRLAENRDGTEALFPKLTRDGLRYWTRCLCEKLKIPVVTPHGLRGTHATASMRPHANPHEVAAALGHTSFRVTQRHYAKPQAIADARQESAAETLTLSKNLSKTFGQEDGAASA